MKYDIKSYEAHKETLEELLKDFEEWSEYVSSSVKYDFTRFAMYFSGASEDNHVIMSLRGSKITIAETISRLHRIFDELGELEKEFENEVNHAG